MNTFFPRGMRPVLHPNGFAIRLIAIFQSGMRLRLHTWAEGISRLDSPHDHRSWFISIPLWGTFREKRYREVPGDKMNILVCHATSSGNGEPLTQPGGTGEVEEVSSHTRIPFVPYFCSVDTIHSLVPKKDKFAATLVLFGPNQKVPKVWLPKN